MNIFVTDFCPRRCAEYLDDKRVVKMVLETAQILSTAVRAHGYNGDSVYKATHVNHPVVKWVCESRDNYMWTLKHFVALCREYTNRYGKTHKSQRLTTNFFNLAFKVPEGELTSFANCAANNEHGVSYKHIDDVYMAYKLYLCDRWESDKRSPTWYGKVA